MKTIRPWLLGLALLSATGMIRAQQTDTATYVFTLAQAVDYAQQHSTSVQNAMLDQVAAADKVKEVVGIGLPQINGTVQVNDYLEIPTSLIPAEFFGGPPGTFIPVKFGTKYNATAGISASQLLFSGSYLMGVKGAKTYQELAQKNVDRTRIETASDVTKAYYTALVNVERKTMLNANLDRLKKLMEDTKALKQNGFVEQIDLDRITVTYNNLQTDVANVQRLLDLSLVLLKYQIGMDQSANLILKDKLADVNFTPAQPESGKFDYTKRVEYQLANLALTGQHQLLKAERFGYIPTLALFGSFQTQAQRTSFDFFDTDKRWFPIVVVGLQLNVPIFDGLQRHYRVEQAKVGVLKAENDLVFLQRTIDMQQAMARVTLQNTSASLESQKANLDLAQEVFDVAKKKYDQGVGSNLEIINAETSLKEAQTNYFNALYDAVVAKVEYDKSMGTFGK